MIKCSWIRFTEDNRTGLSRFGYVSFSLHIECVYTRNKTKLLLINIYSQTKALQT